MREHQQYPRIATIRPHLVDEEAERFARQLEERKNKAIGRIERTIARERHAIAQGPGWQTRAINRFIEDLHKM
jgi:hypothetical protein